jgi:hypothetical protein
MPDSLLNETNQIFNIFILYLNENRKLKTDSGIMRLSRKILPDTPASCKLIVTQRRQTVKLTAEAPGHPVYKCSSLTEIGLTVFEEKFLCYCIISLKIAGNI